jgi:hypothetical protein
MQQTLLLVVVVGRLPRPRAPLPTQSVEHLARRQRRGRRDGKAMLEEHCQCLVYLWRLGPEG